ncbi:MAG: beta-ribofuranosylaminobenzene 5'-phosphate synthase family protein [Alphaproteobacteria bacterium]
MSRHASVTVDVPARLHLGFLDLNGGLGRRFGSIGIAVEGIRTRLHAVPADGIAATGPSADRAALFARRLAQGLRIKGGVRITVEEAIPEHAGLGSGTQLGLAVGSAYARLYGLSVDARTIAQVLGRGARSGIGIGVFEQGGVLVDGGRRDEGAAPAPIVARMDFPEDWRILLVLDEAAQGLHGAAEIEAFRALPPFPAELAAHLCRLVLMVALPALAEADLACFSGAVAEIQSAVGDYFAAAQGGRYASERVAAVLEGLRSRGVTGIGQSSWGPTGFALLGDPETAKALHDELCRNRSAGDGLRFMLCRGRNRGGQIEIGASVAARLDGVRR